jgi:hypothetical protein
VESGDRVVGGSSYWVWSRLARASSRRRQCITDVSCSVSSRWRHGHRRWWTDHPLRFVRAVSPRLVARHNCRSARGIDARFRAAWARSQLCEVAPTRLATPFSTPVLRRCCADRYAEYSQVSSVKWPAWSVSLSMESMSFAPRRARFRHRMHRRRRQDRPQRDLFVSSCGSLPSARQAFAGVQSDRRGTTSEDPVLWTGDARFLNDSCSPASIPSIRAQNCRSALSDERVAPFGDARRMERR